LPSETSNTSNREPHQCPLKKALSRLGFGTTPRRIPGRAARRSQSRNARGRFPREARKMRPAVNGAQTRRRSYPGPLVAETHGIIGDTRSLSTLNYVGVWTAPRHCRIGAVASRRLLASTPASPTHPPRHHRHASLGSAGVHGRRRRHPQPRSSGELRGGLHSSHNHRPHYASRALLDSERPLPDVSWDPFQRHLSPAGRGGDCSRDSEG